MNKFDFKGVVTALVTPFSGGKVDMDSFRQLLRQQIDGGIEGLVINGTTGESPTLEPEEVAALLKAAKDETNGQIPLIVGTGSNDTKKTIDTTLWAAEQGADAALVVVPYYNKPPQRGLVAHFKAVADVSPIPIILYDVPGRTIISLATESIVELSQHKNIVGIKDATGDLEKAKVLRQECPEEFVLSSGDDNTCMDFMVLGGDGVISVISHLAPADMVRWSRQARAKEPLTGSEQKRFLAINQAVGIDTNPIPVKAAVWMQGTIASQELRLPLMAMAEDQENVLRETLSTLELI